MRISVIKFLKVMTAFSLALYLSVGPAKAFISKEEIFPFGNGNHLIINKKSGLFSISYKGKTIINDAAASFNTNGKTYQSNDYAKHNLITSKIEDELGVGTKTILLSEAPGKPTMRQYFYCYTNQEFIITQLEISGEHLSSNRMAPLISQKANLPSGNDVRSLFVPFDNDTFISYDAKPLSKQANTSAEVGVIYDDNSRQGLVLGSLNQLEWKTGVKSAGQGATIQELEVWGGYSDVAVTRDSMEHGALAGNHISSPKMFVGYFDDWRDGMESYAKTGRMLEPPYMQSWTKGTPIGWNSWGVIREHLTYEKAIGVVNFFDKEIPDFRNEDETAYIDLDSFWDNMVDGGFTGDFSKLKEFVAYCKERKLEPGVYWAPFTDWGFKGGKDRIAEGGNYPFSELWTKTAKGYHDLDGGRALDPTHPGTQLRIAYVIGKLKECGFKMIKIDFLSHAAAESTGFYDRTIHTGMQAYRVGMECLSDALDNTMLVYAAISPSLATARYAHIRRIACDAWKSIKDTEYTLNSVTYGWWQTYLYDYVDADHLVFENENEGTNRARLISGLITGTVILGDDYSLSAPWQQGVKQWLQLPTLKKLISNGKAFRPVMGNTGTSASAAFIRHDKNAIYLAVFNYQKKPLNMVLEASRLGLDPNSVYQVTELLDNSQYKLSKQLNIAFQGEGAYIYQIALK